MPAFEYHGINTQGKNCSGTIDADSERGARLKIRKIGVFPTSISLEGQSRTKGLSLNANVNLAKYFESVSNKEVAGMTRQLSTLLTAHIPLVEAIAALVDQVENPKLRRALSAIKEQVVQGVKFSDALAAHPAIFSKLFIYMVAAGETSGAMETVMLRLAELMEKAAQLQGKIIGALMYPAIMGFVSLSLVSFLVVYVVPKVTKIFEDVHATLPLPTKILIATSDFLGSYWYLAIGMTVGGVYGFKRFIKTPKGKDLWDAFTLKAPIFGKLFRMLAIARFTRTLATLLASGAQLLNSLEIVKNIVQNNVLMRVIEETRVSVREGQSLAEPLRRSGQFPPIVTHMIAVGERTGELEPMLNRVADDFEAQIDTMVGTLTTLLEPIMILVMGGVVSFIVMSILLPILQLNDLGS